MDIGKAFAFVFEDAQWVAKLLIGAAILLFGVLFSWLFGIPLLLALALLGGYVVAITRRVMGGELDGLPEWDDWAELIADGLKVIVISIVYALPIIILTICLGMPSAALAEEAEALSSLLIMFLSCISVLWGIAVSVLLPAAIAFWVANDDLAAAFRFGEVFAFVRDNLATYLIAFLMSWVASFVGGLGFIVCGLGWLVTVPYSYIVTGHIYGQAYVASTGQVPLPVVDESA
jgi:hypothetical protein